MRCDKEAPGVFVPGPRVVQYYADRASRGGLQISEATDISLNASAYPGVPGVFTASQLAGWKKVTDAVHAKGGFLFCQLWRTGRATSTAMRGGEQTVSSSAQPMDGSYLDGTACADDPPRPLTTEEVRGLVAEFAAAAKRAVTEGGFDGVEIHGANGYLLEQFLHDNINNTRTDAYGGSLENRCRFLLEVLMATAKAIGAERTGVRLSPFNYFQGSKDSDPNAHWSYLCEQLAGLIASERPVYVHMIEPRFDEVLSEQQKLEALAAYTASGGKSADTKPANANSLDPFRAILKKAGIVFLSAGSFNRDNVLPKLAADGTDAVVFGRHFIANPDLVKRLENGWPLNSYDRATFYGADPPEKGYNDNPLHE